MRLSQYLEPELALTGLPGSDAESVIRAISAHLAAHVDQVGADALEVALLEREAVHTTALGRGVAVPHATIPGLPSPILMIGRTPEPLQFGPSGTDPVWLFFVLVSPPGREGEHIKLLARICRLVRFPDFLQELKAAPDVPALLTAIRRMDEEHV